MRTAFTWLALLGMDAPQFTTAWNELPLPHGSAYRKPLQIFLTQCAPRTVALSANEVDSINHTGSNNMNAEIGGNLEHSIAKKASRCMCGTKTNQRLRLEGLKVAVCAECVDLIHFKVYGNNEQVILRYEKGETLIFRI